MSYLDSERYTRARNNFNKQYKKSIVAWLHRYGVQCQVRRLTSEVESIVNNYAGIVGKDRTLASSSRKSQNKTTSFNIKLGILNQDFYNINNEVMQSTEVIYNEDLLKVGDIISTHINNVTVEYVINTPPETYYEVCYKCQLQPLKRYNT